MVFHENVGNIPKHLYEGPINTECAKGFEFEDLAERQCKLVMDINDSKRVHFRVYTDHIELEELTCCRIHLDVLESHIKSYFHLPLGVSLITTRHLNDELS